MVGTDEDDATRDAARVGWSATRLAGGDGDKSRSRTRGGELRGEIVREFWREEEDNVADVEVCDDSMGCCCWWRSRLFVSSPSTLPAQAPAFSPPSPSRLEISLPLISLDLASFPIGPAGDRLLNNPG